MSLTCKERKRIISTIGRLFGHPPNVKGLTDTDLVDIQAVLDNRLANLIGESMAESVVAKRLGGA